MNSITSTRGWLSMAGAFVTVMCGYACYYTLPVFYPTLITALHCNRTSMALGGSIMLLSSGIASPGAGFLSDRFGPRIAMLSGITGCVVALFAISHLQGLPTFYAACALFGVSMSCFSVMVVQLLMAQWFDRRRGFATGFVISGMGMGGAVGPLFVSTILNGRDWRGAFLLESECLAAVTLPIILLVIRDRHKTITATAKSAVSGATAARAFRTPEFWMLAGSTFCIMFSAVSLLQHIVLYMRELHFPLQTSSRALSTLLFASVTGRVCMGFVSDHLGSKRTLAIAYTLVFAGCCVLMLPGTGVTLLVAAAFTGFGYGGSLVLLTLTTAELFGLKHLGTILGTVIFCFTAGGALGPILVGALADHNGGYQGVFLLPAASALTATLLAIGIHFQTHRGKLLSQQLPAETFSAESL